METLWNEYERLRYHLEEQKPGTDQYSKTLELLNQLMHVMKQCEEHRQMEFAPAPKTIWEKFSDNQALVGLVGNLGIALLVLNYERGEIITSRAFSFIRPK